MHPSRLLFHKLPRCPQFHRFLSTEPPLSGIRVLDLTRIVAGPYCTMILGDLGAEVIKIERPFTGDECRKWGPPFIRNSNETDYFVALNRNKMSVCVDLKSTEGREVIYGLAKKSDVFVENYVPGKLDELGLGYGDVKKVSPGIVYCSVTGFGSVGPYKEKPGYDVVASSMGGLLHVTGPEGGDPVKVGVAVTDMATGLYAHGAIMAALLKRMKTGVGQKIDCDLFSTQVASLINLGSNYLNNGKEGKRLGTAHESIVPYQAFKSKDGYFTIGAASDEQFKDFCKRIGRSELSEVKRFSSNRLRVVNRKELLETLQETFLMKTNKEWWNIFKGSKCPNGPVNSLKETFSDPHIKAIDIVKSIKHKTAGEVKIVGPPVKFSDGGAEVRTPPPVLGEHTDYVLENILEYSKDKIEELKKAKIVQ